MKNKKSKPTGRKKQTKVTRKQFLRTAAFGVIGAAVLGKVIHGTNPDNSNLLKAKGTSGAVGGESEILVVATGKNPQDMINVQWALDNVKEGGTVRLRGTFNFSDVKNGKLQYSGIHVSQAFAPWYDPHYLGMPMYFVPGTAKRYVKIPYNDPDDPNNPMNGWYIDPYMAMPVVAPGDATPEIPVMVYGANDNRVFVTRNVTITGEKEGGKFKTKIVGGAWTFTVGANPYDLFSGAPKKIHFDFFFDSILGFPWDTVRWDAEKWMVDSGKKLEVTIKDLKFSKSHIGSVLCVCSTALTIKGNHFEDCRPFDLASYSLVPGQTFSGIHAPESYPVTIPSTGQSTVPGLAKDLHSGKIVVSDNLFDGKSREIEVRAGTNCGEDEHVQYVVVDYETLEAKPYCVPNGANAQMRSYWQSGLPNILGWAGSTIGARAMLTNADLLMTRNTVKNTVSIGLSSESNYGTTLISNNDISLSGEPTGADLFSNAIWVADEHWGGEFYISQTTIKGNTITKKNPYGDVGAIMVQGQDGTVLSGNEIRMSGESFDRKGIFLYGSRNCDVGTNKLKGPALFGAMVLGIGTDAGAQEPMPSESNVFRGNNFSSADLFRTYLFGPLTKNNTVRGYSGGEDSVIDENELGPYSDYPNQITGVTPMKDSAKTPAAEAAKKKAEAMARWRDTLKLLREEFGNIKRPKA